MDDIECSSSSATSHRIKSYKYKGRDVQEMRRGREEEGFQLRKQKKELLVGILSTVLLISNYISM